MKHEAWVRDAEDIGVDLTAGGAEVLDRLHTFATLLREHAIPYGMIARGDEGRLWERHLLDCIRAIPAVPDEAASLCDLGTGAGLPGLVLAICLPGVAVTLTDTRRKRATFLTLAIDRLGLENTSVHAGRAESLSGGFDVCTARAFSDVAGSWAVAEPLLAAGGVLLYWAGERFQPSDVPGTARTTYFTTSALARSGPVVIMARQ